ncbi:MAG: hypothetical protein L3J47_11775, partial [Sulfurovum sp.]|nr:hypothetical protein [Sulfurovum sp.]
RGMATIATGMLADAQSNEAYWWTVEQHNTANGDGDIILTATHGSIDPSDPEVINLLNGIASDIVVSGTAPVTVDIDLGNNTSQWLIYNKDDNSVPSPFYRVRFIKSGGWTGLGQTGNVVGDDINTKKTRRLDW